MAADENLITTTDGRRDVLRSAKRVAVIGIKPEDHAHAPAFYVPDYLQRAGYDVIPVPVYYPDVTTILGQPVYRDLADIPGEVDLVVVFRRPDDVPEHVDEILARGPDAVWLQLGIRNDEAAARWAAAGIRVVQDACAMVEHRAMLRDDPAP